MGYYTLLKVSDTTLTCIRFHKSIHQIKNFTTQTKTLPKGSVVDGEVVEVEQFISTLIAMTTKRQRQKDKWLVMIQTSRSLGFTDSLPFKKKKDVRRVLLHYADQWLGGVCGYEVGYLVKGSKKRQFTIEGIGLPKQLYSSYQCLEEKLGCTIKSMIPYRKHVKGLVEKINKNDPTLILFLENQEIWGSIYKDGKLLTSMCLVNAYKRQDKRVGQQVVDEVEKLVQFYTLYHEDDLKYLSMILPNTYYHLEKSLSQLGCYFGLSYQFISDEVTPHILQELCRKSVLGEQYKVSKRQHYETRSLKYSLAVVTILGMCLLTVGLVKATSIDTQLQHYRMQDQVVETVDATITDENQPVEHLNTVLEGNDAIHLLYQQVEAAIGNEEEKVQGYLLEEGKLGGVIYIEAASLHEGLAVVRQIEKAMKDYKVVCYMGEWLPKSRIQLKVEVMKSEDVG